MVLSKQSANNWPTTRRSCAVNINIFASSSKLVFVNEMTTIEQLKQENDKYQKEVSKLLLKQTEGMIAEQKGYDKAIEFFSERIRANDKLMLEKEMQITAKEKQITADKEKDAAKERQIAADKENDAAIKRQIATDKELKRGEQPLHR